VSDAEAAALVQQVPPFKNEGEKIRERKKVEGTGVFSLLHWQVGHVFVKFKRSLKRGIHFFH
jgi:hypothetical protein